MSKRNKITFNTQATKSGDKKVITTTTKAKNLSQLEADSLLKNTIQQSNSSCTLFKKTTQRDGKSKIEIEEKIICHHLLMQKPQEENNCYQKKFGQTELFSTEYLRNLNDFNQKLNYARKNKCFWDLFAECDLELKSTLALDDTIMGWTQINFDKESAESIFLTERQAQMVVEAYYSSLCQETDRPPAKYAKSNSSWVIKIPQLDKVTSLNFDSFIAAFKHSWLYDCYPYNKLVIGSTDNSIEYILCQIIIQYLTQQEVGVLSLDSVKKMLGKESKMVTKNILQQISEYDRTEKDIKIVNIANTDYFKELSIYLENAKVIIDSCLNLDIANFIVLKDTGEKDFLKKEFFLEIEINAEKYKNYIKSNPSDKTQFISKELLESNKESYQVKIRLACLQTRQNTIAKIERKSREDELLSTKHNLFQK